LLGVWPDWLLSLMDTTLMQLVHFIKGF
jgi:hypothetical protein